MEPLARVIDLGFAEVRVPPGTHVCQIYTDPKERDGALLRFLATGLRSDELTACFSDNIGADTVDAWLAKDGLSVPTERDAGRLTLASASGVYFQDGRFDPDRMLDMLAAFHADSVRAGSSGARVIGEMSPEIDRVPGGSRLMEYEASVNRLLRTHPVTAVCQYDARAFDGETIMDVLTVHPMMFVRGAVIQNPFFVTLERP